MLIITKILLFVVIWIFSGFYAAALNNWLIKRSLTDAPEVDENTLKIFLAFGPIMLATVIILSLATRILTIVTNVVLKPLSITVIYDKMAEYLKNIK
ncbi:MAG: hypothetical protein UT05_C0001G0049 [Parcubacteria group bacterium GW2011_GWF2_38_76]|nr:MAG: hypothetical protein UT05_C0001G0049 [Parcubacteria group bacterium GW2011_GWF2_38_76]HBM45974.1 hypothetical protein [Patescibacteria group bacterium]